MPTLQFKGADIERLKNLALTLDVTRKLPKGSSKKRLFFAPTKYLDPSLLDQYRITFCQLPYQIYQAIEKGGTKRSSAAAQTPATHPSRGVKKATASRPISSKKRTKAGRTTSRKRT